MLVGKVKELERLRSFVLVKGRPFPRPAAPVFDATCVTAIGTPESSDAV